MKGKICLVTGGNSGIGKATALGLAKKRATVVILCRNQDKGQRTVKEIISKTGNKDVDLIVADLASIKSVRQAAEEFKSKYEQLHVLINNAAVALPKRTLTVDGFESTFAINYLSHFLLTQLLIDRLEASSPSRIINMACKHKGFKFDINDLMLTEKYSSLKAHGMSKVALILFTKELARRLEGSGITINCTHPGYSKTNLLNQLPWAVRTPFNWIASPPEVGAISPIFLASSSVVEKTSGQFFVGCKEEPVSEVANDPFLANRLWDISIELIDSLVIT